MTPSHGIRITRFALLPAALLASGCGIVNEMRVDDRSSAPIVSARVLHRFAGSNFGIELDYGSARAKGSQQLDSFNSVTLGGNRIDGPATLQHTVRAQHVQLAFNHLLFKDRPVELEWFAGVSAASLDWSTTSRNSTDPQLARKQNWYGPAGGVLGRVNLGSGLALEARYSASVDTRQWKGGRNNAELALAFTPVAGLQLRAGMAESQSDIDNEWSESQLSMRARGPFLGLRLGF